ncbi:MoaD/ThiS family protein [Verticiella sediminum]|uniref:MoaD/ThiS family protein n=1 Tax=Verticiella sediminum TaxID=1247510 RepID=UPI001FE625E4|nr:MoaD/ThiS family protein [Verticiella sediminum]
MQGVESVASADPARAGDPGEAGAVVPVADPAPQAGPRGQAQSIALVYFARIAEITGRRGEALDCPQPLTGAELLRQLAGRYPEMGALARLELAVNQEHAGLDATIHPGDEVAVFEPVTGG